MKNLIFLLVTFPLLMNGQETPTSENINPVGNWYFGAEIGPNAITSYSFNESDKSLQGGILAEFYTGRHWSLTTRIKYFKTGLSYFNQGSGSGFLSSSSSFGQFEGAVFTIPLNVKWEFRIWKNLSGNLNFGLNYNYETDNKYYYSNADNYNKYSATEYGSYNSGFGFNYFINKKRAVFLNIESYIGGTRGQTGGFVFSKPIYNTNTLVNFGYKYNFKN